MWPKERKEGRDEREKMCAHVYVTERERDRERKEEGERERRREGEWRSHRGGDSRTEWKILCVENSSRG